MKDYRQGPIPNQNRSCTDLICCIIFFALTIFMFCVGIYAWTNVNGNFQKLKTAYDPDGKGCGVDYVNFPYIYFASPHSDSLWVTVCVSKCPQQNDTVLLCQPNSVVKSCLPVTSTDNTQTVQIYDSSLTANTLCLPTSSTLQETIAPATSSYAKMFTGLMQGWALILISIPIAIVIALILMLIIRFTAGFFIYILIILLVVTLVALGVYIWTQPVGGTVGATTLFSSEAVKIVVACLLFLLAILLVIFICCCHARLALATAIIQVSASFVAKNCMITFVPLVIFVVTLMYLALWILEALGYYSLGTPSFQPNQYPFQHFTTSSTVIALGFLHVFYLFWTIFFLIQSSDFIISGTAIGWFFKRDSPYCQASSRYLGKHIGSVCMGAFFMALIGFIKFIYTLLAPDEGKQHSGPMWVLRKCCDCLCCLCIGKLFDWFNAGAYAWINVTGDSYCTSGMAAASLRAKNLGSTTILAILQVVFSVLVRGGITALTVLIIYLLVQNVQSYSTVIQDCSLLLVVVGLLAFAVSCFFMSVYTQSMEALYTAYLMEIDGGLDSKNCPDELKNFVIQAQQQNHFVPVK